MEDSPGISYLANRRARRLHPGKTETRAFDPATARAVRRFHGTLPGYSPTPLVDLSRLARDLGLANVWVKDESPRFGLKAFKVLGASYAASKTVAGLLGMDTAAVTFDVFADERIRARLEEITLITATDGNHGRAVAWTAQQLGCTAVVYLPKGSAQVRFDAISSHGADTHVLDCNYDDAVRQAAADARVHGWTLIQDTAWQGYEAIPLDIMRGYMTILLEVMTQLGGKLPTHVFVQCGVGSLAAAVLGQLNEIFGKKRPVFVVVEPLQAACCYHSLAAGGKEPRTVEGPLDTIMAGLACGRPSTIAWRILRDHADVFVACSDEVSKGGMRLLAHPRGGDPAIVSGESGAVTAGLLAAILGFDGAQGSPGLVSTLGLDHSSNVLLLSTEGDTNPETYQTIVHTVQLP